MTLHVNTQQRNILPYIQAMGAGAITGMRSMSAPAIVRTFFDEQNFQQQPDNTLQNLLGSSQSLLFVNVLSVAEMITDKLPFMPDRTDTLPLLGRGALGAMAGAAIFMAHRKQPLIGAVVSGTTTILSTYASYHLRTALSEKAHLPDLVAGFVEDIAMVGLRKALFSS